MTKELSKELIVFTRMHQLLDEATTFDDFKTIRNKAEAARMYARSARLGLQIQIHAAELKLECERRAGQVISELDLSQGGRPSKKNASYVGTGLEQLGINKNQSSRWQAEAQLPEEAFQQYLAECRAANREPTSQGLLQRARQYLGKEPSREFHTHGNDRLGNRPCQSMVLDSHRVKSLPNLDADDEEDAIIADLQLHHSQLVETLADYSGQDPFVVPTATQRHYIGHLLSEMGECLASLRELRQRPMNTP